MRFPGLVSRRHAEAMTNLRYPPYLMDPETAAAYLSISVRKLAEYQAAGDVVPKAVGSMRRYRRPDLEEFADRLEDWTVNG